MNIEAPSASNTTERFQTDMDKMIQLFVIGIILLAGVLGIAIGAMHKSFGSLVKEHALIFGIAMFLFGVCLLDGVILFLWYQNATEDPSFKVLGRVAKSSFYASGVASILLLYICGFIPHKFMWLPSSIVIEFCVCYIVGSMCHFNLPLEADDNELMKRIRANKYELISTHLLMLFGIHAIFLIAMSVWLKIHGHSMFKEHKVIVSIALFLGCVFFVGSLILAEVYRRATQDPAKRRLIRGINASLDAIAVTSALLYLIATYIPTKKYLAPLILIPILCVLYIMVRVFIPPAATEGGES